MHSGSRIAHYEILHQLGEGGMGVVYKARDLHLDRLVALKLLRPERIGDAERKRFAQEARAASALNHPNIVQIYDIGMEAGTDYIAMEFVDGKALDQLIGQRRMDLNATLRYGIHIASALAKAHTAGIVHRDLKPSNIIIGDDDTAKVLDFGLAKLLEAQTGESQSTKTLALHEPMNTERGVIMGTVAYMAPEQAEGGVVDARADIFAFGAVLYEMITGSRAFSGKSKISILSAVLNKEPASIAEHAQIPWELEKVINRCLRKDPARRCQHMADIRVVLEDVKGEYESGRRTAPQAAPRRRRLILSAVVAAGAAAAVAIFASWLYWRTKPSQREAMLTRVTSDAGFTTDPVLSPDGKLLAYASDRSGNGSLDIWIQQVGSGQSIQLTSDPTDDHQPGFSPDGTRIVFRSERDGGGVYVVPVLGGEARRVAPNGFNPQFSPNGQAIAYWTGSGGTALPASTWIASVTSETPRRILPEFPSARFPRWSPDGKYLVFTGSPQLDRGPREPTSYDWWIVPANGGTATKTGAIPRLRQQGLGGGLPWVWTASNQILFAGALGDAVNIWRIPVDRSSLRVSGRAERLTIGTQLESKPSTTVDKLMTFSAGNLANEIWSLSLEPVEAGKPPALVRVTESAGADRRPSLSLDGSVMAYISSKAGTPRIWIRNLARGSDHALTGGSGAESWPLISPDGARVAFTTTMYPPEAGLNSNAPLLIAAVRTGVAEIVCGDCYRPESWSRDGNKLLIFGGASTAGFVSEFDLLSRKRTTVLQVTSRNIASPRYSPDGKWVSFMESPTSDTRQIFVAPLRGTELPIPPAQWIAITDGKTTDREPRWSEDGSSLYFASNRDGFTCLWAQRLDANTKGPAGSAVALRHFHSASLGLPVFDSGTFGLSVGGGRMFMSLSTSTGNIWLLRLP